MNRNCDGDNRVSLRNNDVVELIVVVNLLNVKGKPQREAKGNAQVSLLDMLPVGMGLGRERALLR